MLPLRLLRLIIPQHHIWLDVSHGQAVEVGAGPDTFREQRLRGEAGIIWSSDCRFQYQASPTSIPLRAI